MAVGLSSRTQAIIVATSLLLAIAAGFWFAPESEGLPPEVENTLQLHNLPANRWVEYNEARPGSWRRQGHAGMAFDSKRGSLLIFGSDTHGKDWDNSVHEFHIREKRWETHYPPAAPETYRADEGGRPIAGTDRPLPWAMHTYDAIEYHPGLDALVVTSTPLHNPGGKSVPGITQQPTWIYDLSSRRWSAFANNGKPSPTFFGGSSAYDPQRDTLIAYRGGVWELDAPAGEWRRAAGGHHDLHHTMVFAQPRGTAFVFGDYTPTTKIWAYRPGATIGAAGTWQEFEPRGDPCPPYGIVPVAYDPLQDVFVLVVNDVDQTSSPPPEPTTAATYLYDPATNTYTRLPAADLPALGMNFMMAWDSTNEVALLVTGDWKGVVTVWAMRPVKRGGTSQ